MAARIRLARMYRNRYAATIALSKETRGTERLELQEVLSEIAFEAHGAQRIT